MSIKISGAKEAAALFKDIEKFLSSTKPMEGIVEDVKKTIEERTAKGKDYKNRKFKPYSEAYKRKKGKTRVNLRDTGLMLNSMKIRIINPKHGVVEIRGKREIIAQIHTTGTGRQPKREFMNISEAAERKIVKKHYDDPLLKLVKRTR